MEPYYKAAEKYGVVPQEVMPERSFQQYFPDGEHHQ